MNVLHVGITPLGINTTLCMCVAVLTCVLISWTNSLACIDVFSICGRHAGLAGKAPRGQGAVCSPCWHVVGCMLFAASLSCPLSLPDIVRAILVE